MNQPSYLISIHSFDPISLSNLLDSISSHNISDNFIFLFLFKNDFVKLFSTINQFSPKLQYQHLILENFLSKESILSSPLNPDLLLLSYSLFLLKDTFQSLIHIQSSFIFTKNISIQNIIQSFNQQWTLFCEDSLIPIPSQFFTTYTPIQQKLLNLKLKNMNPSSYPLHFYHSHHLNSLFDFHNLSFQNLSHSLSKWSDSPILYLHYIFFLLLNEQIILYPLSENFDSPKSYKTFLQLNHILYHFS